MENWKILGDKKNCIFKKAKKHFQLLWF